MENTIFCFTAFFLVLMTLFLTVSIRIVPEEKRLQVYRMGRYLGEKGPGLVMLIPFIDLGVLVSMDEKFQTAQNLANDSTMTGETRTLIDPEGMVVFAGKNWEAISKEPIQPGTRVRVKRVLLDVEKF